MCRILALAVSVAGIVVVALRSQPEVQGCASVPRVGGPSIAIAEESAIIVWDPVKKVQHFIRRAAFDTKSPDFGFLVPTPTMPKLPLESVEDGIFRTVDVWLRPKTVEQTRWSFKPFMCMFGGMAAKPDMTTKGELADVRVLHEQKVGGFDVNVLEADDAEALAKWIKEHGFSADPELYDWLKPYVASKWKITAFKISQDPKSGQLATTKAVRMSFATERPFFPYREPEPKASKGAENKKKEKPAPTEVDGVWRVESAEHDRQVVSHLKGNRYSFRAGVFDIQDFSYTLDPTKEPKWLDAAKSPGIYKLEGGNLIWCRGTTTRPTKFDSREGLLMVLRRDWTAEADEEPGEDRHHGNGRLLRVLFISDMRMDGKLGNQAWHAKIPWANEIADEQRKQIAKETGVPESDIPAKAWLTVFEDRASPRPGKDEVYFDPAQDRSPIEPPPFVKYHDVWLPIDCVMFGVMLIGLPALVIALKMRRKRT